ncbi:uncharacterized [Tachysurus ichikawai]
MVLISRNAASQRPSSAGTTHKYLAHPSSCLCPGSSSFIQIAYVPLPAPPSEMGDPPSPLPLLGSVPVTALPLKHSCSDVAVAVRLSQMTGQNSRVTSAELLEN